MARSLRPIYTGGGGGNDAQGRISLMTASASTPSPAAEFSPPASASKERGSQQQWGQEETKELIAIRAELERDFAAAKRSKTLWEVASAKMRERGYRRTAEQCKCKWKNLINRYKGIETSDIENGRLCPFFDELHRVFTERARNMHRLLLESEAGSIKAGKKVKRMGGDRSSDEFSEDEDKDEFDSETEMPAKGNSRKRKGEITVVEKSSRATNANSTIGNIQEMLKEFFQQQQRMEMQWRETMERSARERQLFEEEWQQSMEKIERERLMIEQAWREREEQRRIREEMRAERRDAMLTTLLNKLIRENNV